MARRLTHQQLAGGRKAHHRGKNFVAGPQYPYLAIEERSNLGVRCSEVDADDHISHYDFSCFCRYSWGELPYRHVLLRPDRRFGYFHLRGAVHLPVPLVAVAIYFEDRSVRYG